MGETFLLSCGCQKRICATTKPRPSKQVSTMADAAPKEKKLTKKELRILERQRAAVRSLPVI